MANDDSDVTPDYRQRGGGVDRDIKPDKVLLLNPDEVVVLDPGDSLLPATALPVAVGAGTPMWYWELFWRDADGPGHRDRADDGIAWVKLPWVAGLSRWRGVLSAGALDCDPRGAGRVEVQAWVVEDHEGDQCLCRRAPRQLGRARDELRRVRRRDPGGGVAVARRRVHRRVGGHVYSAELELAEDLVGATHHGLDLYAFELGVVRWVFADATTGVVPGAEEARFARRAMGYSRESLARVLGTATDVVRLWEEGRSVMPANVARGVLGAAGALLQDLRARHPALAEDQISRQTVELYELESDQTGVGGDR